MIKNEKTENQTLSKKATFTKHNREKFSFEYLLLPPRSAPAAAPPGLAAKASAPTAAARLLTAACQPADSALPRRPGIGPTLQRHPFSGLVHSAGELLHTP